MPNIEKLDLYKLHKAEYATPRLPKNIPQKPAQYLAIEGAGHPTDETFTDQIGALYAVAFTTKMKRKFAGLGDYAICKLEAQWLDAPALYAEKFHPSRPWHWRLMIRSPDFLTAADIDAATATLLEKGKTATVKNVKLTRIDEGLCVQMLHLGPYENESQTIALMKTHAEKTAHRFNGPVHEIYLSDPHRVAPEKLKTILRIPIASK